MFDRAFAAASRFLDDIHRIAVAASSIAEDVKEIGDDVHAATQKYLGPPITGIEVVHDQPKT
jgi:hypothetical protein